MKPPFSNSTSASSVDGFTREEFARLLAENYQYLYASALSVAGNPVDADDIAQEVCAILWVKCREFDPSTSFRKWACSVAFNVARSYMRDKNRRRESALGEEAVSRIIKMRTAASELLELRREVLQECLGKLSERDSQFLYDCYSESTSRGEYAKSKGLSVEAVYSKLKRLRQSLLGCVRRKLGRGIE